MPMTPQALALSRELAVELGQIRREGDTWYVTAETDTSEQEHRIDLLAGRLYCSCRGFVQHQHCKHAERVRRFMNNTDERHLIVADATDMPDVWRSPQDLARRLADLKQERGLVQDFFQSVMVPSRPGQADGDYGVIPGTDKPTLFKAGAEKLCELYGYAPIVSDIQETPDYNTGHYRVVVRIALVHKGSGVRIAEGIGECNTRETRYWYRWVFASDVPAELDKAKLKTKEITSKKNKQKYTMYRVENDELFSVWNTILKMAKKRALVDATLSSTRSSGLFTQSAEHLDEWIDAEFTPLDPEGETTDAAEEPDAIEGEVVQAPTKPTTPAPPEPTLHVHKGVFDEKSTLMVCECGVVMDGPGMAEQAPLKV